MDTLMIVAWTNGIGLVLNMVGVLIVFIYGFPQPSASIGGLLLEDNNPTPDGKTLGHHRRKLEATKQTYKVLSQVGLFFMFVGFVLQFAATIYGAKYG
jgi:hypothetical protein